MRKKELIKRYSVFFVGLLLTALGVAYITKASLGTSPISAIPYSLSLIIPQLTLGNWTIIFSFLLIALQWLLLKSEANKAELILQIVISFVFGYFIDFWMFCLSFFEPSVYITQFVFLLIGIVIISFGAYFQMIGGVVMIPGDAFARASAKVLKKTYPQLRLWCDIAMTAIAAALCLIFLHQLTGVREGTIVASLLIGNIVKIIKKLLSRFENLILPENKNS